MSKKTEALENEILRVMSQRPFRWMTPPMIRSELSSKYASAMSVVHLQSLTIRGYLQRHRSDEIPGFVDPHPLPSDFAPHMCYRVTEDGSRLPAQRELKHTSRQTVLRPGWAT